MVERGQAIAKAVIACKYESGPLPPDDVLKPFVEALGPHQIDAMNAKRMALPIVEEESNQPITSERLVALGFRGLPQVDGMTYVFESVSVSIGSGGNWLGWWGSFARNPIQTVKTMADVRTIADAAGVVLHG